MCHRPQCAERQESEDATMKLTVIGCGHLGATHAACMAEIGHDVLGVDIDQDKVDLLNTGRGQAAIHR